MSFIALFHWLLLVTQTLPSLSLSLSLTLALSLSLSLSFPFFSVFLPRKHHQRWAFSCDRKAQPPRIMSLSFVDRSCHTPPDIVVVASYFLRTNFLHSPSCFYYHKRKKNRRGSCRSSPSPPVVNSNHPFSTFILSFLNQTKNRRPPSRLTSYKTVPVIFLVKEVSICGFSRKASSK